MDRKPLSRGEFLRLAALGVGGLYLRPFSRLASLSDFPQSDLLGRVAQGAMEIKARPNPDSQTVEVIYEDTVVPWVREVTGEAPSYIFNNQRWVETDRGYAYSPLLQPVRNLALENYGLPFRDIGFLKGFYQLQHLEFGHPLQEVYLVEESL